MRSYHPRDDDWQTLEAALVVHTVEELALLGELLPGPAIKGKGRKDQRVADILSKLAGEGLRAAWERLDDLQRAAIAEAIYAPNERYDRVGFLVRHEREPDFGKKSSWSSGYDQPSLLMLFIHGEHVPRDLRERLREFVPRPAPPVIPTSGEPPTQTETVVPQYQRLDWSASSSDLSTALPLTRVETSSRALADVIEVLRLAETGQVKLTPSGAEVGAAGMRAVASVLVGPDFLDEVPGPPGARPASDSAGAGGPIRAFAWPRLLVAGRLAMMAGGRLGLTGAGKQATDSSPAAALRSLWKSWLQHPGDDEVHRLARIRGTRSRETRLFDVQGRRRAIADAMSDCPTGQWIRVDDFFGHIHAAGLDFRIAADLEQIRLDGLEDWSLSRMGDEEAWPLLQGRYILCFLMEYAATLGTIDIAYTTPIYARSQDIPRLVDGFVSRYDGLRFFRVTDLGSYCLDRGQAFAAAPPKPAALDLADDLRVRVKGAALSRADELVLERIATPSADGVWDLTRSLVLASAADGYDLDRATNFLESRSGRALPTLVANFFADCRARARAVTAADAGVLFDCGTEARAREISLAPSTRALCVRAGDRHVFVAARARSAFRRALWTVGYGVRDEVLDDG